MATTGCCHGSAFAQVEAGLARPQPMRPLSDVKTVPIELPLFGFRPAAGMLAALRWPVR